ncbi:MAG: DHA2 family efflux MFS transporter permease subunit [Candidatus Lambdaproteobacteria bacterium]|nr:DHA2 family efflux MFS transporter permease subunit [Candidatus Lambdaproteobacteria bacterium]
MATAPGSANRMLILITAMIGGFLAVLDSTTVNIALPNIMTTYGVNVQQAKWVTTAAMLTAAATVPATGWLGRRLGYGPVFMLALTIYIAGATVCSISWSLESLVTARIFQSMGSGMIQPTGLTIITRTFPSSERGKAIGIWGIGQMVGSTMGPTAGGFLVEYFGWRSIFWINVPTGLMLILLASVTLPRDRDAQHLPFDWVGYLSFATFLIGFLLTVDNGDEEGWTSTIIFFGAGTTLVAIVLFISVEWDSPHPLMPLRLFRHWNFALAMILNNLRSLALHGATFLVPLFVQRVQGRDAMHTGLLLMPGSVAMVVMMPIAGALTDRIGGKWPTAFGFLLSAFSLFQYASLDPATGSWDIMVAQVWRGIGLALINAPVITIGLNAIPREDAGHGAWMLNLTQRYGGALTIGMLSLLLNRQTIIQGELMGRGAMITQDLPSSTGSRHWSSADARSGYDVVLAAKQLGFNRKEAKAAAAAVLRSRVRIAATAIAYQNLFLISATIAMIGIMLSLLIRTPRQRAAGA